MNEYIATLKFGDLAKTSKDNVTADMYGVFNKQNK